MSTTDSEEKILKACNSLGHLEGFAIGKKPRFIFVACMELDSWYNINVCLEDAAVANEVVAFLNTRNIVSYRTPEHSTESISVGYIVNVKRDAAFTISKISTIVGITDEPRQKAPLALVKTQVRLG